MSTIKLISLVSALFALAVVQFLDAFVLTGVSGYGTAFFLAILFSPFSVIADTQWVVVASLAFWLALLFSLFLLRFATLRVSVIVALFTHYIGVAILCSRVLQMTERHYVGLAWRIGPQYILLFLACYLVSQLLIWFIVTRRHDAPNQALERAVSAD